MLEKFIENQNNQYVFWILSEFFEDKYNFENVNCDIKILNKKLDKHVTFYESAKHYNGNQEEFSYQNLKVEEVPPTNEEIQSNYFNFMKRENVLMNMCKNEDFTLDVLSFTKKIDLIPSKFSESKLINRILGAKNFSKLFNWAEILKSSI